jgi:ComF family protein
MVAGSFLPYKNRMKARVKQAAAMALDTILPPRCVISGKIVDAHGMIAPDIWGELDFVADPKCDTCGFPFDFDVSEGSLCASCLDYPPSYDSARAALKYDEASRGVILGFKHADKTHAAAAFMPWLKLAGQRMLEQSDMLIPVPLHRRRLIARRYNQAAIIAQYLSKDTGVPAILDALQRKRATKPQGHMSASQRFKNVRSAFVLNPEHVQSVEGKVITLIDDVYTTGATVNECTKVLNAAGAGEVHILTLARVARDGFG